MLLIKIDDNGTELWTVFVMLVFLQNLKSNESYV